MAEDVGSLVVRVAMDNSSFQQGVQNLNRQMKVIQSEFKNATSGLKEHGKGLESLKAKQEMLSKSIDVQSKLIKQYREKLKQNKDTLSKNAKAQEQLKTKIENVKTAYENSKKTLGENNEKTKELRVSYEQLSTEYTKNEEKIRNNVRAIETWTTKTNNAEAKLKNMQSTLSSTSKEIAKQESAWNKLSNKLNFVGKKFQTIGAKMSSIGKEMTMKLTGPIVAIGGIASKIGMDFEASMSNVSALSGTTGQDLKKLENAARNAGSNTSKSAKDAANAMGYMALAGYDNKQMMEALMPVLRLAEAGNLDLAQTSDLVTDSLSSLGKNTKDLPVYLDQVAKTAANSNTNIDALMEGLIVCGGTVKNLNTPLDEANALLGILANRGKKGSEAGTALNSIMVNLTTGAGKAGKAMKKLKLNAFDTNGKFKGMANVLIELKEKTAGMTEEQRNLYLSMIGGKTQLDTLQALLAGVGEEYGTLREKVKNSTGALDNMAKTMQDNNKGSITQLKSALEELGIKIYEVLKPAIASVVNKLKEWTDKLNNLTPAQQETIVKIAKMVAVAGPLLLVGGKIIKIIGGAITAFSTISGAIAVVSSGAAAATPAIASLATAFTVLTGPVSLTIAAIAGIGTAVYLSCKHFDKLKEKFKSLSTLGKIFAGIAVASNPVIAAIAGITLAIKGIKYAMSPAIKSVDSFSKEVSKSTQKSIKAYEKLDKNTGQVLMNMKIKGDRVTKETASKITSNFSNMSKQITSSMDKKFNDDYNNMQKFLAKSGALRDVESKKILQNMKNKNEFEKNVVKQGQDTINKIMKKASDDHRQLSTEEWHVVNTIKGNMMRDAITTMSKSQREQKSLLERQKLNASKITAEQAAEVAKNSAKQRDKVIKEAEQQYDKTVQNIQRQRDELGTITDEQAKHLIVAAQHQKDETINKAQGMHQEVIMEAQKQAGEHADKVDWETGQIKSKWQVLKEDVSKKASETWEGVRKAFENKKADIEKKAQETVDGVKTKWENAKKEAKVWGSNVAEKLKEGLDSKKEELEAKAKELKEKVKTGFKNLKQEMKTLGQYAVQGLEAGMEFTRKLKEKAEGLAKKTIEAVKKRFDIHSPSRVMAEIGKFVDEGLAAGIEQNSNAPATAAKKVSDLVTKEIENIKSTLEKETKDLNNKLYNLQRAEEKALRGVKGKQRYSIKDEYETKKKAIKNQIALRRKQADEEIKELQRINKMSKEQLKKEVEARKEFTEKVNNLNKQIVDALKEKYESEEATQEETLNKEIAHLDKWKDESIERINSVYESKIKSIEESSNAQIKAIENELKVLDKTEKVKQRQEKGNEDLNKIDELKAAIEFEHNYYNKKQLQKELDKAIVERQKELNKEALEDKKEKLKERITTIKENADKEKQQLEIKKKNKLDTINRIYEAEKKSYNVRLEKLKRFYEEKTREAMLQAEAEKLIMQKNQNEIVELLHSYSKDYEIAGQTLGERLLEGFAPKIKEIKNMISNINASISSARQNALEAQSFARNISNSTVNNNNSRTNNNFNVNVQNSNSRDIESTLRSLAFTV